MEIETAQQRVLDEIIRRIVQVAAPEQIILFGSAARGEVGPGSDIDLLVVKSGAHRRRTAQTIYMNLYGVGRAVDVIVVTPEDVERYRNSCAVVIEPALREGRVIYARWVGIDPAGLVAQVAIPGRGELSAFSSQCSGGSGGADGLCVGGAVEVTQGLAEPSVVS